MHLGCIHLRVRRVVFRQGRLSAHLFARVKLLAPDMLYLMPSCLCRVLVYSIIIVIMKLYDFNALIIPNLSLIKSLRNHLADNFQNGTERETE